MLDRLATHLAHQPIRNAEPRASQPARARAFVAIAFFALAHALLLTACASPPDCAPPPERDPAIEASTDALPPFFRVEAGRGATIFLFGTLHLGPPEGWRFSPPVQHALAEADTLVFEIDLREANEENVSTYVANYALLEPGIQLEDRVTPETQKLLDARQSTLAQIGFPASIRKLMKPWFLALGIIESNIQRTEYTTKAAADRQIFETLGTRELIGLETVGQQMDFFDNLSPQLQDLILRDALARYDEAPQAIEDLVWSWRVGDEETLTCLAREGIDELPELEGFYEILLDERNRSWVSQLEGLLESRARSGTRVFVAVGALHLFGEAGVPNLLREAGYRVESIDQTETP